MSISFAAVLIIMALLIGFVVLILRSLAASAGVRIRQDMRRMLNSYDGLVEEKSVALRALQEEYAAVEAALERLDASSMEKRTVENETPVEQIIGAASVPTAAAYRAAAFGQGYGTIRDQFRLSAEEEQYIVDQVLEEMEDVSAGRGKQAAHLREQLSFDTVFRMAQLPSDEQLELLDSSLEDEDWTLLRDYWEAHDDKPFDVMAFCNWLDVLVQLEGEAVVIRGEDSIGGQICEGIQVIAGNRLYDYSIKEKEIG